MWKRLFNWATTKQSKLFRGDEKGFGHTWVIGMFCCVGACGDYGVCVCVRLH